MNRSAAWLLCVVSMAPLGGCTPAAPAPAPEPAALRPGERSLPAGFVAARGSTVGPGGWPSEIVCVTDGAAMVLVPAGRLVEGLSPEQRAALAAMELADHPYYHVSVVDDIGPPVGPVRTLDLPAFYIDRHEVTNQAYRQFIARSGQTRHRPGIWRPRGGENIVPTGGFRLDDPWKDPARNRPRQPVTCVSAEDAAAYAAYAGKALPTAYQWRRAALGDDTRLFPWGSDLDPARCRSGLNPDPPAREALWRLFHPHGLWVRPPADVGSFPGDVSPFGCLDMAGNVSEWVLDPPADPTPAGGNADSPFPSELSPRCRAMSPDNKILGFRTILNLPN